VVRDRDSKSRTVNIYIYFHVTREKVDLNLAIIEEPINNTSFYYQYETIHIYQTSTSIVIVALSKRRALCPERGEPSPSRRLLVVLVVAEKRPVQEGVFVGVQPSRLQNLTYTLNRILQKRKKKGL